jgi:hypothetical protein
MKIVAITTILAAAISSVVAAPAMIWQNNVNSGTYSSEEIDSTTLFSNTIKSSPESLASVVFVVSRNDDGLDGLSFLAGNGHLPKTQSKADEAAVYHYVTGVQTPASVIFDAKNAAEDIDKIQLSEVSNKLGLLENSREADVLVVSVAPQGSKNEIDEAIVEAIEHPHVGVVIVTAQRSTDEVARERDFIQLDRQRKLQKTMMDHRRRLDEDQDGDDDNSKGKYYVNLTPNIFSGILFTLFFIFIGQIGIGCLNQISFSDSYVDKYPSIGREN